MSNTAAMQRALTDVVSRGDFAVPPYPAVALRLQRRLGREGYGVAEIADVLAADAALATTVLAAANSGRDYRSRWFGVDVEARNYLAFGSSRGGHYLLTPALSARIAF